MLYELIALLCCSCIPLSEAAVSKCDPTRFICSGKCGKPPPGLVLRKDEPVCMRNDNTGGCLCWLTQSRPSLLKSLFECDALVNGSASKITCELPSHCFSPEFSQPSCISIRLCDCVPHSVLPMNYGPWQPIMAKVHTSRSVLHDGFDNLPVEKYSGDVREFSLKHLLFLLGFVIAPLLCWCLLNFLHEGKCRKKPPQLPEAVRFPTTRSNTVDNMNNDEECTPSAPPLIRTIERTGFNRNEAVVCIQVVGNGPDPGIKCESPPPYEESSNTNFLTDDCGPPPSYDDAIHGLDPDVQLQSSPSVAFPPLTTRTSPFYVINCGPR